MSRRTTLAVCAIAAGALVLRVVALDFGLPAVYNPDEIAILSRALALAKGDLNPHNFLYPTFFFYVLFTWIGGYFVLARLLGHVTSLNAFQQRFFVDPTGVYLAGRALGAVSGALATVATAAMGRALFDAPTGLVAAALLAVAPLAVMDGHYIKHDVPATLAVVVAMWRLVRCWPEGGARAEVPAGDLVIAAICCGVAWSTHYYCVFLAVPLALTVVETRRRQGWGAVAGALAVTGAAAVVTFFALSPYLLVEPATAWRDIVANRRIVVDRASDIGAVASAWRYLVLLTAGVTVPVLAMSAIGTALLAIGDRRRALLLLAFPIPFLIFIANTVPASRYLNPVLPFVALTAAHAIRQLARVLAPRRLGVATAALAVAAATPALLGSVRTVAFFAQDDTRTIAQRVIASQVPPGATILIQPYSVQIAQSRESLEESLVARLGSLDRLSTRARLRLAVSPWPVPSYRVFWLGDGGLDEDKIYVGYRELRADPIAALRARGIEYVVLKRFEQDDEHVRPLATALVQHARLIASVSPYDASVPAGATPVPPFVHNTDAQVHPLLSRPGPILDVFALP